MIKKIKYYRLSGGKVMKTLVCQLNLGRTRVAGYTLYDHETMAFEEITPRDVKYLIKEKQVNGLKLNKDEEIELDLEGFNAFNIPVKSGVGNYTLLKPAKGIANYEMYSLTKVFDTDEDGLVYEVVSTRCARLPMYESKIRDLYAHKCVIGLWIDERGMIRFADGVDFEDLTKEGLAEKAEAQAAEQSEIVEAVQIEAQDIYRINKNEIEEGIEEKVEDDIKATADNELVENEAEPEDNSDEKPDKKKKTVKRSK